MAAFYKMNPSLPLANDLTRALREFDDAKHRLEYHLAAMIQMTDTQRTVAYGFADDTASLAAKNELNSDVGGQLLGNAALAQMLAQFAG